MSDTTDDPFGCIDLCMLALLVVVSAVVLVKKARV